MNPVIQSPGPPPAPLRGLAEFQKLHGARVRRAEAMEILGIASDRVFTKVVEANPNLRHRVAGEEQDRYITALLFGLLPESARRGMD